MTVGELPVGGNDVSTNLTHREPTNFSISSTVMEGAMSDQNRLGLSTVVAAESNTVDWSQIGKLIDQLYDATDALEEAFPGRKFTLDGHLVGSVGEVVAAYMFDLTLNPASTKAHDALSREGRKVEIKLTQGTSVSMRHKPEHLLVLSRPKGRNISVVYNGPGAEPWNASGKLQKNGQRSVTLKKLASLDVAIRPELRLRQVRDAPV